MAPLEMACVAARQCDCYQFCDDQCRVVRLGNTALADRRDAFIVCMATFSALPWCVDFGQ